MAKELPYFRFTASEWLNDDISIESYEMKGFFIDLCAWYWFKDCSITIAMLQKKFSNTTSLITELIKLGIIKNNHNGTISINFLDVQYDLLSEKRLNRSKAGRAGGLAKSSNAKDLLKQKSSYKDKDNNKYKDNKNIPTYEDFKTYALEKQKDVDLETLKFKYDAWIENDWKNGNGKDIKNWKTSLLNTLPYIKKTTATDRNQESKNYAINSSFDT